METFALVLWNPSLIVYEKLSLPMKFVFGVYVTAPPVPSEAVPFAGWVTCVTESERLAGLLSLDSTAIEIALLNGVIAVSA